MIRRQRTGLIFRHARQFAFKTDAYEMCQQSGPILFCTNYFGAPGPKITGNMQNGDEYGLDIASGPQGTFALSNDESAYIFRPC